MRRPKLFGIVPPPPPPPKKMTIFKDDLVNCLLGLQTHVLSNLSNCALARKALMDFASTCTCLRMRERSCGGGIRNVENI